MNNDAESVVIQQPKFPLHTVIEHYKGGVYFIVGLPVDNVLEDSRERSYAYLIDEHTICHRSQADMEVEGKFRAWTDEDYRLNPGKLDFIKMWSHKLLDEVGGVHMAVIKNLLAGPVRVTG